MALSYFSLPDYWLQRPTMALSSQEQRDCDALLAAAVAQGAQEPLEYTLPIPKWRFLCYVAEEHGLALHGSGNPHITRFEPRQPHDLQTFGAQNAVYAAADGIWPIYYAIVDRIKSPSIVNACLRLEEPGPEGAKGVMSEPYYCFSISKQSMAHDPYHAGVVYLLPRESFIAEPPFEFGPLRVHTAQLASFEAVVPLAKIAVVPEDFPFLAQMRTHEDARLADYAQAMQRGLPWPE